MKRFSKFNFKTINTIALLLCAIIGSLIGTFTYIDGKSNSNDIHANKVLQKTISIRASSEGGGRIRFYSNEENKTLIAVQVTPGRYVYPLPDGSGFRTLITEPHAGLSASCHSRGLLPTIDVSGMPISGGVALLKIFYIYQGEHYNSSAFYEFVFQKHEGSIDWVLSDLILLRNEVPEYELSKLNLLHKLDEYNAIKNKDWIKSTDEMNAKIAEENQRRAVHQ